MELLTDISGRDEAVAPAGSGVRERVQRLRAMAASAQAEGRDIHADWGNFGNEWGDSPTFHKFGKFENGY